MLRHPKMKTVCRRRIKKEGRRIVRKYPAVTPTFAERDDHWERLFLNITRQGRFWKRRQMLRTRCWSLWCWRRRCLLREKVVKSQSKKWSEDRNTQVYINTSSEFYFIFSRIESLLFNHITRGERRQNYSKSLFWVNLLAPLLLPEHFSIFCLNQEPSAS